MKTFSEIIHEMQAWLRANNLKPEDYLIRCRSEQSERRLVAAIKQELGVDLIHDPDMQNRTNTIQGMHISSH